MNEKIAGVNNLPVTQILVEYLTSSGSAFAHAKNNISVKVRGDGG